jgi:very-short-patch-repair endonuclease
MGAQRTTRDEISARLAGRQHGVVAREQLLAAEWTRRMIERSVQAGRLRPLFRGVFAVGHSALPREGWWMAALLACGDAAALSHTAAGAVWRFRAAGLLPIEVTTPSQRGRKQPHLLVHRAQLAPSETMRIDGLRVTTPARTIVDLAAKLKGRPLREVIERAQDLHRFHPAEIRTKAVGRPGTKQLNNLLDLLTPDNDNARSHLERLFLAVTRRARLPRPNVNHPINGKKRDFVWPTERLVVEVDSHAYHSSKEAMRRDRQRDRELTALGWRPARFTYEEVAFEPGTVGTELDELLDARGGSRTHTSARDSRV